MAEIKCYALLVKHSDHAHDVMFNPHTISTLKKHRFAAVQYGYDPVTYLCCLVFKTKLNRDRVAAYLEQNNVEYTTRDDALIDEKYYKGL